MNTFNSSLLAVMATLFILSPLAAQVSYNWPCAPFDQQHPINGTFCENRPSGSISIHHFHDGVDIDLAQGNNVYSVIDGTVTGIGTAAVYGINAYVRVGRYAYVHVNASPGIQVGSVVKAYETVIGTTNSWNHIHLKDGNPGSEINPLRKDSGLSPMNDPYFPAIDAVNFYINGTTTRFADRRVTGLVDIVAKARDKTDNWVLGDNNGIYSIGYQIYDSTGSVALTDPVQNFTFYHIPPSDAYVTNVFFTGSDISNYYYTVTNRITSDGYWDTRNFPKGNYKVRIFTSDPYQNVTESWTDVTIVEQDVTPPDRPKLTTLLGNDSKKWVLSWQPNSFEDLAGYKVYFSLRGDKWSLQSNLSEQITAADTSLVYENFNNQFTAYFKLTAFDRAAVSNFSDTSDVLGVRLSESGPQVLIVNGFSRRDGYLQNLSNPFVINYGQALSALDISFNSCSDQSIIQGTVDLSDYQNVLYFTGDNIGDDESLSEQAQLMLSEYLRSGGNLVLFGSEIGADLFIGGSTGDSTFFADMLKSTCLSDSSNSLAIVGLEGTIFEGPTGQLTPQVRPDVLSPSGSEAILKYGDGGIAGIYFQGILPGGTTSAQLIYLAFPLEQLDDSDDQNRLIENIMNRLGVVNSIAFRSERAVPRQAELKPNYPNPFNPKTAISWQLAVSSQVDLSIYNIQGQKVATLVSERQPAGMYTAHWDATGFASGVYFYQLTAGAFRDVKKMILLR